MSASGVSQEHPSPNFGARRGNVRPDMVVLHYTAMISTGAALKRLCAPEYEVSAHYLIGPRGQIFQLVHEDQRAWHAGAGCWGTVHDVNSHSIGIELANDGGSPFPEPQMAALEGLLAPVMTRHAIVPERVIGHSDMACGRKIDPGARFDWRRLALQGLAVWPDVDAEPAPDWPRFRALARTFGYPDTVKNEVLLQAFRLHFRPWGRGPLDATDMGLVHALAKHYPVDPTFASA